MCQLIRRPPIVERGEARNIPFVETVLTFKSNSKLSNLVMIQVPCRRDPIHDKVLTKAGPQARVFCDIVMRRPYIVDSIILQNNGLSVRTVHPVNVEEVEKDLTIALQTAYGFKDVTITG